MLIVSGATGHIGNVLVRKLLAKGEQVGVIIHRKRPEDIFKAEEISRYPGKLEYFEGDLADPNSLAKIMTNASGLYHLAAKISISQGEFQELYKTNVLGTRNIMQAALAASVPRVVYTSSVHALLEAPHGTKITEIVPESPDQVEGDYAKSKVLAYHEVMQAVQAGLNAVVTFPAGVIGPYDFKPSQLGQLIRNCIAGKKNYYIEGAYNYVDVRDVADGLISAFENGERGSGYCLSGEISSVAEYFEAIKEVLETPVEVRMIDGRVALGFSYLAEGYSRLTRTPALLTPYSVKVLRSNCDFSSEKAETELGYTHRSVKDSVKDAVKWHLGREVPLE